MSITSIKHAIEPIIESLGYPVAWPNVDFHPQDSDQGYLRVNQLGGVTQIDTLGCDKLVITYQVDALQREGENAFLSSQIADEIIAEFESKKIYWSGTFKVVVMDTPSYGPAINNGDGWFFIPVTIRLEISVQIHVQQPTPAGR